MPGDDSISSLNESRDGVGGGYAYIDESAFSGEPFPVAKRPGDSVYGASINQLSVILVRVTATGEATALSRIVRLVDEAQGNRAPIQAQAGEWQVFHIETTQILVHMLCTNIIGLGTQCVQIALRQFLRRA